MVRNHDVLDQRVEQAIAPRAGEQGKEGPEPERCDQLPHLGAVKRNLRVGAVASDRDRSCILSIECDRKLPQGREAAARDCRRRLARRHDATAAGAAIGGSTTGGVTGADAGGSTTIGWRGRIGRGEIVQSSSSAALGPVYSAKMALTPHGFGVPSARAYSGSYGARRLRTHGQRGNPALEACVDEVGPVALDADQRRPDRPRKA